MTTAPATTATAPTPLALAPPATWPQALDAFWVHLRGQGLRHSTRKNYRHHLNHLATFAAGEPWDLTPDTLLAWLDTRGTMRRTCWAITRLFYAWAERCGYVDTSPLATLAPALYRGHHERQQQRLDRFPTPWLDAVASHESALIARGCSARTKDLHVTYLARLAAHHPGGPWTLTTDDLARWIAAQPDWKPETKRSARQILRGFYDRAHRAGLIETNPAAGLATVRVPRGLPRPATLDAFTLALAAANDHDRLMLLLGALAGLRAAEIAQVRPATDIVDDHLFVVGKGGVERRIPLHPRLAAEIDAELSRRRAGGHGTGLRRHAEATPDGYLFPATGGTHMTPGNVTKRVAAALPGGWTAHSLRHRFASQAYAATRDLRAVQELLGHSSPLTTARYTQVPTDALKAAVFGAG